MNPEKESGTTKHLPATFSFWEALCPSVVLCEMEAGAGEMPPFFWGLHRIAGATSICYRGAFFFGEKRK